MEVALYTIICLYALIFVRIKIAADLRMYIIEQIHFHNMEQLTAGQSLQQTMGVRLLRYDLPSFGSSVFDLTMWNKAQARRKLFPAVVDNRTAPSA